MKIKQITAAMLCAILLLSVLSGCGDPDAGSDAELIDEPLITEADPETTDPEQIPVPEHGIDFEAALAAFAPDTIMIRSGDITMTWAEFYVFLFRPVSSLAYSNDIGIEWDNELEDGSTLADMVIEYVTEEALQFMVIEYGAKELNITLSSEDIKALSEDVENLIEMYGSRDELEFSLRENGGFYSFEVFESLIRLEYTMGLIMADLYGDNGESFPDDDVSEYALRNEYMMAKHILILSEEGDDAVALSESEDILKQLQSHINDDDFFDIFDALMHEHSEDTGGLMTQPNGYLFQPVDMVAPFSEACAALEIGHMSDIVQTDYGYHIILRLPLDFDMIPIGAERTGQAHTLRQLAAMEDFDTVSQGWRDSLNPVFSPEYRSIDLATIFKWL